MAANSSSTLHKQPEFTPESQTNDSVDDAIIKDEERDGSPSQTSEVDVVRKDTSKVYLASAE